MSAPRARFIPDLLETHVEELEYLWGQRRTALCSKRQTLRDFVFLNERVEAHIQGLLAVPSALPALLKPRLAEEGRDGVFAAACPLLRLGDAGWTGEILASFAGAQGPRLAGLRDAFSFAPSAQFLGGMRQILDEGDPAHAAAAAVVLANQRLLDPTSSRLADLLLEDDPVAAEPAWLAASHADAYAASTAPKRPFKQGFSHADPKIRHAALRAAAWSGQALALTAARRLAGANDRIGLEWLAALGGPEDLPQVLSLVAGSVEKADGCSVLARYGHPGVLETLGRWMAGEDIALAAAAGEAFTLMTGSDVRGKRQTAPVADDADEFEREFAPLVWTPDLGKAQAWWREQGKSLATGNRWRRGKDVGGICPPQTLAELDLEARWDAAARAVLAGNPVASPPPIF